MDADLASHVKTGYSLEPDLLFYHVRLSSVLYPESQQADTIDLGYVETKLTVFDRRV